MIFGACAGAVAASGAGGLGCSGGARAVPPQPPAATLPAPSTHCYAGVSSGMGQQTRTVARRTMNPAAGEIIEDVSNDDQGAHGQNHFHVVMTVTGDAFTMAETGGAFAGTGTLEGEPWAWTSWRSVATIPNAGIEVTSSDDVTPSGMVASKEIRQGGKVVATTHEELKAFECAKYDAAIAELSVAPVDPAVCERACRNYASLKLAAAGKPADEIDAMIASGLGECVQQCVAANNGKQTTCLAEASTVTDASGCMTTP